MSSEATDIKSEIHEMWVYHRGTSFKLPVIGVTCPHLLKLAISESDMATVQFSMMPSPISPSLHQ